MIRILLAALAVVIGSCFLAAAQQHRSTTAEAELMQIERDLAEGFVRGDKALFERLLADDHTSVDFMGKLYDKKAILADLRPSTKEEFASVQIERMRVRVYGETAVVSGDATVVYTTREGKFVNPTRFTDTFVKRKGRWRQVASHSTRIMRMSAGDGEPAAAPAPPKP